MTARSIWNGAINFGLVNIGVKLYAATQDNDLEFHQLHLHDGEKPGRISYKRVCRSCQEEVSYGEIAKGFDTGNGTVVLTKEDIDSLPLESTKTINVSEFVPANSVQSILMERHYTLTPEKNSVKAYSILVDALGDSDRVGIVKVTLRQREQLAMLHVRHGRMALTTLRWADEVREVPEAELPETTAPELEMATMLIDQLSATAFDPSTYQDGFRAALQAVIDSKSAGAVLAPAQAAPETKGGDLMEALRASIEAAKLRRQPAPKKRRAPVQRKLKAVA
jgi:DNA end-binding protein Ku